MPNVDPILRLSDPSIIVFPENTTKVLLQSLFLPSVNSLNVVGGYGEREEEVISLGLQLGVAMTVQVRQATQLAVVESDTDFLIR